MVLATRRGWSAVSCLRSVLTQIALSAPRASGVHKTFFQPLGPTHKATISLTCFLAFKLAASCMAISQKGLMYILVFARSTQLFLILIWVRDRITFWAVQSTTLLIPTSTFIIKNKKIYQKPNLFFNIFVLSSFIFSLQIFDVSGIPFADRIFTDSLIFSWLSVLFSIEALSLNLLRWESSETFSLLVSNLLNFLELFNFSISSSNL